MNDGPASTQPARESLVWVDILRGLAALQVVLYHMRVDLWVGFQEIRHNPQAYAWHERLAAWGGVPLAFGSGVMLFFVISGFCVHLPETRRAWPLDFKKYAIRRFFRIYPPYLAAVVLTIGVDLFLARANGQQANTTPWLRSALMVQNYHDAGSAWGGQWYANPSLWSLPVEMELYLVYPIFFYILRRLSAPAALGTVAVASTIGCILYKAKFPWMAGNFLVYWLIWCAGAWLAELYAQNRLPRWKPVYWLGVLAFAATGVAAQRRDLGLAIDSYAWAGFGWMLFWWGLVNREKIQNNRSILFKALAFVGTFSYSLYLLHFPFFRVCGVLWTQHFGAKPASLLISFAFALMAVGLAWLFYKAIEAPSHRLARTLAKK
jgi:peptidoglycan/LPS O-acetylase OafA/YrhL